MTNASSGYFKLTRYLASIHAREADIERTCILRRQFCGRTSKEISLALVPILANMAIPKRLWHYDTLSSTHRGENLGCAIKDQLGVRHIGGYGYFSIHLGTHRQRSSKYRYKAGIAGVVALFFCAFVCVIALVVVH